VSGVLLDTHVIIWLASGTAISAKAKGEVDRALADGTVYISAVSAWEIALLSARGRISMQMVPGDWIERFLTITGCLALSLSLESAVAAALLAPIHRDPADRFLIATAILNDLTLITRDTKILDYADAGHLRAVAC
jgi:PIN domain nuclease of toxin-antitoxin system